MHDSDNVKLAPMFFGRSLC